MTQGSIERVWDSESKANYHTQLSNSRAIPSLGTFIHDLRRRKNLTQADLAEAFGWKSGGVSRISDIEQGHQAVDREFVERFGVLFNLYPDSLSELLLVGKFLPTRRDVDAIAKHREGAISDLPQPVMLTDFAGRVLEGSDAFFDLFGLQEVKEKLKAETPNWVEVLFDPAYGMKERLGSSWSSVAATETDFLFINHMRYGLAGIRWQELLLARLNSHPEFRELWNQSSDAGFNRLLRKHPFNVRRVEIVDGEEHVAYIGITSVPLVIDRRMHTVAYLPEAKVVQDRF